MGRSPTSATATRSSFGAWRSGSRGSRRPSGTNPSAQRRASDARAGPQPKGPMRARRRTHPRPLRRCLLPRGPRYRRDPRAAGARSRLPPVQRWALCRGRTPGCCRRCHDQRRLSPARVLSAALTCAAIDVANDQPIARDAAMVGQNRCHRPGLLVRGRALAALEAPARLRGSPDPAPEGQAVRPRPLTGSRPVRAVRADCLKANGCDGRGAMLKRAGRRRRVRSSS